jgi:hypothetical protein
MKKTVAFISLVLFQLFVIAQDCTKENVTAIPGKWKPGLKGASDHTAADMAKEKALMDGVIQTIRTNFAWQPVGGDITYGNVYSIRGLDYRPLPVIKVCNQYHPYVFYQHYFCADGRINREDFSVSVTALVNDIPFKFPYTFFDSKKDKLGYDIDKDPETAKYGFIDHLPEVKNNVIEYNKTESDIYRVLTKPGQSPYMPMSKKEYYENWKIKYAQTNEGNEAMKVKFAQATNTDDSKRNIEMYDGQIAQLKGYISKIDDILTSKPATALAMPAFSGEEAGEYFESNTKENPHQFIIKPNLSYYNNQLSKSSPQVISIHFSFAFFKDKYGDIHYADEAFYKELERIKIMDLLTVKLQTLLEQ